MNVEICVRSLGLGGQFGEGLNELAKQQDHHNDNEQEADRAATDVECAGKNGRE